MSPPPASDVFPAHRHHRRAKRSRAVVVAHDPFAVLLNFEIRRKLAKLSMTQQEPRIARMPDSGLVDQKRLRDQNASRPERARKLRKQRALEKIYIHDCVERLVL